MKAIQVQEFGGPQVLRFEEIADLSPGDQEVVVRLHAAGVNPVETYIRAGTYAIKPPLPYTPGSDGAGVIEKIGARVKAWKPGQRVYVAGSLSGTYAQSTLCRPEHLHTLPERVSFAQGAAIGVPYATAYRALFQRAQAKPGETVLIHGASGGVGLAATQMALAHGLEVIGTAGSARGLKLLEEQGVSYVLDHTDPNYLSDILGATCGRGVDIILEMLANVNLGHDLTLLARGGRVVIIGSRGPIEINPREIMSRDATVLGMVMPNASPAELESIHAAIVAGLKSGTLSPLAGREIALQDAA
ncbi:MAG: NADPH:quinone reductase, partial [Abditibacteriota bacterium]|nr:NADPH:quinone reductase [Abditibacteriota bacterium]